MYRAIGVAVVVTVGLTGRVAIQAAPADTTPAQVTFTKDIAPILQRSCQNCHRPDGVAPMSLVTYEEVRPYARAIKQRTSIGPHRGVMPPWYIEKNIGIQQYKNDPSLSDAEIAMIGRWADNGAPQGNPADMPPPRKFDEPEHMGDRHAGPRRDDAGDARQSERARLVGRNRKRADPASPRTATSRRCRCAK